MLLIDGSDEAFKMESVETDDPIKQEPALDNVEIEVELDLDANIVKEEPGNEQQWPPSPVTGDTLGTDDDGSATPRGGSPVRSDSRDDPRRWRCHTKG